MMGFLLPVLGLCYIVCALEVFRGGLFTLGLFVHGLLLVYLDLFLLYCCAFVLGVYCFEFYTC